MAAAAPLFDMASFDAAAPQAFYLWERREEMEAMADACLIVEGTRLPVHTQVLSLASGVLCRLFADLRGGTTGSRKRKADDGEQELTIEAPFAGFSVQNVALFLRLLYDHHWQLAVAAAFGALHDSLAALLRLAHQLEAQRLLSALCTYMAGCNTTDLSLLVDWHEAADACQLDELRTGCLVRLAHAVAAWGGELAPTLSQAAPLERCSARTLVRLLAIMASAGARQRPAGQQLALPAAAAVEAALAEADCPQPFEWTLAAFSGQPAATGERVPSPTFTTAGHTWQLRVYPGGATAADAGCVSVRLYCLNQDRAVRARFTIAVVGEDGSVGLKHDSGAKLFNSWCSCGQLASREQLSQRGLLAGNSLRLRVTITLA